MGRRLQKGISAGRADVDADKAVEAEGREEGPTRGHFIEVKWANLVGVAVRISLSTCLRAMTIFDGPI